MVFPSWSTVFFSFLENKTKPETHLFYFIFKSNHFSQGLTFCNRPFNDWNVLIPS